MLILLDEQIDVRMKAALEGFAVFTVQDKGWVGLKNGALREQLNREQFRYFITADKNLPFQQNIQAVNFTIVLLDVPTLLWPHQQQFAPKLIRLLTAPPDPSPVVIHIAMDGLSKGKKVVALQKLMPPDQILFI